MALNPSTTTLSGLAVDRPANPGFTGVIYYATDTNATSVWDGAAWQAVGGGSPGATGPQGAQGPEGQQGEDGNEGPPGPPGGLSDHDHTGSGDGGTLTNDTHDGFSEYTNIAEPAAPAATKLRLYSIDQNGHTVFEAKGSVGTTRRLARDNFVVAKISEAAGITIGQIVYISGASGANEEIKLAKADSASTMPAFGFALEAGALNAFIKVLFSGKVTGFDTSSFTEGDVVYASATIAGGITATPPSVPPNLRQRLGVVTRSHASNGEVLIQVATAFDSSFIGVPGPPGMDGIDGVDGERGPAGVNGVAGATGISGQSGPATFLLDEAMDGDMGPPGPAGAQGAAGVGSGGTFTDFTKDLGAARRSGTFDITGLAGLTAGKNVTILQTAQVIASKGDARDEAEMGQIQVTGYVVDATTIRAYWQAPSVVVGTYAFAYQVSG